MPKINILIPTYNRADFLDICLDSLTKQTVKDFDVCIYDDGSTDQTESVVTKYKNSLQIRYQKAEKNKGVGYSRNELLKMVTAPYFMWQDSDDIAANDRVEKMLKYIGKADACFSDMYFFKSPNTNTRYLVEVDTSKYTSREGLYNNMTFPSGLFKKKLAKITFNNKLLSKEDVAWLVKLMKAKTTFAHAPEPLYFLRRHPGRLTLAANATSEAK